jgi:hypothetical protein
MKKTVLAITLIFILIGINVISSTAKLDKPLYYTIDYGSLQGFVNDTSGNPIKGALIRVHFHGTYKEDYSNEDGYYHVVDIPLCFCLKNATCSKNDYNFEWVLLSINEYTTYDFILEPKNKPPNAPTIKGNSIIAGFGLYEYKFKATDPEGDDVRYLIDWNDGNSEWTDFYKSGKEITISHSWDLIRDYSVKARAIDIYGGQGSWGYLQISKLQINKSEPVANQKEILSVIKGSCKSINKTGLIINEPIEIYSIDFNLNITGWANSISGVLPICFQAKPIYIKASNFCGSIHEIQPGISYHIWGIAIGNIEWE